MHCPGSPFGNTPPQPELKPALPRNYADVFRPEDYECKESLELESYARNLHNYLMTLLPQNPFPAFLFDKLEKRLDGITSILQKRSAQSGAFDKDKAKERLKQLGALLAPVEVTTPKARTMLDDLGDRVIKPAFDNMTPPLPKKRKLDPDYVTQVRNDSEALKLLRNGYSKGVEEEEEQ